MGELERSDKVAVAVVNAVMYDLDGRKGILNGLPHDIIDEIEETLRKKVLKVLEDETSDYIATTGQFVQGWVV